MKYTLRPTAKFQKDLKRAKKRGYNINLIADIIKKLAAGEKLNPNNRHIFPIAISIKKLQWDFSTNCK